MRSPSKRYRELLAQYQQLHTVGGCGIAADKMFTGTSMVAHAPRIRELMSKYGSRTILDYGAGKGLQYTRYVCEGLPILAYLGHPQVTCYDPAYEPFAALPVGQFDGVISTDTLEHIPEEDIDWVITEMFSYAKQFVYLNIATYPAEKTLPNGENAHCTVHNQAWWEDRIMRIRKQFPQVGSYLYLSQMTAPNVAAR